MYYIVGLGNPGKEYKETRHNIGWLALDHIQRMTGLPAPVSAAKYAGEISQGVVAKEDVLLLYPHTYMNKSGSAVKKLVAQADSARLIVVYDDVDLPFGDVKVSVGRGSGGHNGVQSIITELGSKDFIRVRIGIAPKSFWTGEARRPPAAALSRHVLGRFSLLERRSLEDVTEKAAQAVVSIITDGIEKTMNQFNG